MSRGALSWVEELSGRDLDFGPFRSNPLCFRSFLESLMTGRAGYTLLFVRCEGSGRGADRWVGIEAQGSRLQRRSPENKAHRRFL